MFSVVLLFEPNLLLNSIIMVLHYGIKQIYVIIGAN